MITDHEVEYVKFKNHYSWLTFPVFACAIVESSKYTNVSVDNILAIIHHETLHVPAWKKATVRSYAGAIGYMQVMPLHAKYYNVTVKDLTIMEINIRIGTSIYSSYKQMYDNDETKAIIAYNAGPYSDFSKYDNDWYLYGILEYAKVTKSDDAYKDIKYL